MSLVESNVNTQLINIKETQNDSAPIRTSNLMAPNVQLSGHKAEVNTVQFSPDGNFIASAGRDRDVFIWNMDPEDITHTGTLSGSKLDVLQLVWTHDSEKVATASADSRGSLYDVETSSKIKTFQHDNVVNGIATTREGSSMFLTVGDDCQAIFWDPRLKQCVSSLEFPYQLTSCVLSNDGRLAYVSGIDETIYCFDTRTSKSLFFMQGHKDIVTGLAISSDGTTVLSNSMDNTLRTWDARLAFPNATDDNPSASGTVRALGQYAGHMHDDSWNLSRCTFNNDGSVLATGSADGLVYVWDLVSFNLKYKLPGHKGQVNEVAFHPTQPIIASASSDKTIFLGELSL